MRAKACKCSEPLLSGAINKKIISTGRSSVELKSNPFTNVDTNTKGLSIVATLAWGIAIPLPTAVEPNFSLFIKFSNRVLELIPSLISANLLSSSKTCFLLVPSNSSGKHHQTTYHWYSYYTFNFKE